jgi:hypothetical protein
MFSEMVGRECARNESAECGRAVDLSRRTKRSERGQDANVKKRSSLVRAIVQVEDHRAVSGLSQFLVETSMVKRKRREASVPDANEDVRVQKIARFLDDGC